jgi:hypothetical protein
MHSSPDPSSLALAALPDDAVLAFNVRAFSADHDCATRSHRRRVRRAKKTQCSKPSLIVDMHQALGNLRGAIGLFGGHAADDTDAKSREFCEVVSQSRVYVRALFRDGSS